MKIIFNLFNCGIGNNGGSQSIVRMSNELQKLGHDVKIISNIPNQFTWEKLNPGIFELVGDNISNWPETNVIISTGVNTIPSSINYAKKFKNRHFTWIRGWEKWQKSEKELIKLYSNPDIILLANSEWLVEYVSNHTRKEVKLQYSGIPLENFYVTNQTRDFGKIRVGALAHFTKRTKNWNKFLRIAERVRTGWFRNIEFYAMGDRPFSNDLIEVYKCQPNEREKRDFYNKIDIWVSLSELEGLHVPPMEAGLCGACILVPSYDMAGVRDYAIDDYSAKYYNGENDMVKWLMHLSFDKELRKVLNERLQYLITSKIGSVEVNAKKLEMILYNAR